MTGMFLEELFEAPDAARALRALTGPFWERHHLPPIRQLGLVVSDVEQAAADLEQRGIGPFFIAEGAPVLWRERSREQAVRGKMGLARWQGLELELLEPLDGSSFYTRSVDPGGRTAIHHLGVFVADVDGWAHRLNVAGFATWVRGRLRMGPASVDFAYLDTADEAVFVIEFICWHLWSRRITLPGRLLVAAGRLQTWSGHRSLAV